jgi:hypothetical protein
MDPLLGAIPGAETHNVGGVQVDMVRVGKSRVKRVLYPPGFRWSKDIKPMVDHEFCKFAHVGFLARGSIHVQYSDGCTVEFNAPQVIAVEPGHDGWVVGDESAIVIELDFEGDTARQFGIPETHHH